MPNNTEIDRITENYNRFLSIISHDFKAPLRHTKEFTRLLIESIDGDLNEEQTQYIEFINHSLSRIDKMQAALLSLSRVVTNTETKEKISSKKLIEQIAQQISRKTDISYGDLPEITFKPKQFSTLFESIIKNAINYTPRDKKPTITITADKVDNNTIFKVKDNGIGINEHHYEDVFNMFRRLHAENDYGGGVGAGLTIAKTIIEQHGGKIWLESTEGNGTEFYVQIPNIDA